MTDPAAPAEPEPAPAAAPDPTAIIKSRSYVVLLLVGAVIGVPVAAVAYFFLDAVAKLQHEIFVDLPTSVGFHGEPLWWPLPWLTLSGLLVALAIRYLPGTGGHEPSEGFKAGGPVPPVELFGIVAASFATLSLGVVLGPEAPLIAIGSGLGVLAVHLFKRDAPPMAAVVIGVAGSFAAIATLLGSPIVGAFLLMEMAGLGGPMMELVLVPGLLAAGVGALIFVGLDNLTGFGTFSLNVGPLPHVGSPTGSEFLWAIVIGLGSAIVATAIFRLAAFLRPLVQRQRVLLTPVAGLAVGGLAVAFAAGTTHGSSEVLFSGQSALGPLVQQAAAWTVGALLLLIVCKGLAYAISLSALSRGPDLPEHVHRRRRRHRPFPRRWAAGGRRCGHGRRGHGGRGAEDADDRRAAPQPPLPLRRRRPHAGRDRGGCRVLRRRHLDQAGRDDSVGLIGVGRPRWRSDGVVTRPPARRA